MADCNIDIFYTVGFWAGTAKCKADMTLSANFLSAKLKSIYFTNIGGSGYSTKGGRQFCEDKDFSEGVEKAIEDVADRFVQSFTTAGQMLKYAEEKSGKDLY